MFQELKFDKKRDLAEVDQFGFVNITESIANGYVPNDLTNVADNFDGVDIDPESIIGRPKDTFEAMRMQDTIASDLSKVKKSNQKSDSSDNK